ncbi:MAG: hypothetical protein EOO59_09360, partial [Hymenobacter sp.]
LANVDLQRLGYLRAFVQGEDFTEPYQVALARMAETYKTLPISSTFLARLAEAKRLTEPVAALALAREAEARFPKSRGAARARALRAEIERPELVFSAADIVVPGQPWRLDLTARNVAELHAWAYRITLREWEKAGSGNYDERNRPVAQRFARALKATPAATWAVPVPAQPADYKEQKFAAAGPPLPAGYYLVLLSNQAQLATGAAAPAGATTAYAVVGASELSAVSRPKPGEKATSLLVLHRQSGAALAGVGAQAAYSHYDQTARKPLVRQGAPLATSATGEVGLPAPFETSSASEQFDAVRIWRGTDTLLLKNLAGNDYQLVDSQPQRRTFLFTDRAIYRPGQTVYFKGILAQSQAARATLLTGQLVRVRLLDVNGQTVQTLTFTTSSYGSFNGSLVLPAGLLNGEMSLQTDNGSLSFAVEDYKRPTFLVTLDSVPGRPQLGQPLALAGRARAYAGQATDGATVKYRITRRELWPMFSEYSRYGQSIYPPGGGRGSQEIAHGTTTTDAEGRFKLAFTPPAGPSQPGRRGWEPGYLFEITADVTDAAGETRTGTRNVVIGRNPLNLQLTGPERIDQQHLPTLTLLGTNATGELLPATGTLRLLARRYRPS